MKHIIAPSLVVACLVAFVGAAAARQGRAPEGGPTAMFKAVVHVNFEDPERQKHGLKNVTNMLNEVKNGDIVVICHGKGLSLLVKGTTPAAADVERLMKLGVHFAACENTMRERSIPQEDLLPGVVTVPSGAVEVVRKQQAGHGYFRP